MLEIFHSLFAYFNANPMLIAGIGTTISAGLVFAIKSLPRRIYNFVLAIFTVSFTVNSKNSGYNDISEFINNIVIDSITRNYAMTKRLLSDEDNNFRKKDNPLVVGYGRSFGIFNKTLIIIDKSKIDGQQHDVVEQLNIRFFGRNKDTMRKFISNALASRTGDDVKIYSSSYDYWLSPILKSPRKEETVFINSSEYNNIISKLDFFYDNKSWYVARGIPYKRIILLYGEPGTGKTSLIQTLAHKYQKNIRFVQSLDNLGDLTIGLGINDFMVIEDIDALGTLNRKDLEKREDVSRKSDSKIVHSILNLFDGLKTPDGMVVFITTNHLPKLDPAIIRAGRVDVLQEITRLNSDTMRNMFIAFYGEETKNEIDLFIKSGKYIQKTGAQLQDMFLNNDYKTSIKLLAKKGK